MIKVLSLMWKPSSKSSNLATLSGVSGLNYGLWHTFSLPPIFFFLMKFFFFFLNFWLCGVFVSVRGLSLVAASGGHSSSRRAGLSLSWPLLLRSTGSRRAGSVVVAHGLCCSAACGIFPDQGSNPCPLHQQADSQPLRHQGSPTYFLNKILLALSHMRSFMYYLSMATFLLQRQKSVDTFSRTYSGVIQRYWVPDRGSPGPGYQQGMHATYTSTTTQLRVVGRLGLQGTWLTSGWPLISIISILRFTQN